MKAEEGDVRAGPFGGPALFFDLMRLFPTFSYFLSQILPIITPYD
jgi:hypothetical protein